MRREGSLTRSGLAQPQLERMMDPTNLGKPVPNAQPDHARRATVWKKAQTFKRQTERRFAKWFGERGKETLLYHLTCVAKELEGEMHSIGPHP
jgi:hypothetical protein